MVVQTKVEINGTDVSSKVLKWTIERNFGDSVSICKIDLLQTVSALETIENGQTLEIWRGLTTPTDKKVFDGFVEKRGSAPGMINLMGKDKFYDLVRREVVKSYDKDIDPEGGEGSEIWKDLVTTYGGLTADATTVQSTGTAAAELITKFVCNHDDIFERASFLAETYDFQQYYRADTGKAYFEPFGYLNNSLVLEVGVNVMRQPKWTYDTQEMINSITVIGSPQITTAPPETFNGTGAQVRFSLSRTPINVEVKVGGTVQTGGIPGSSTTFDYYVDIREPDVHDLVFETGSIPPIGTGNVVAIPSYPTPTPVVGQNATSIATYGLYERTFFDESIKRVSDAELRAQEILSKYSTPFTSPDKLIVKIDATSDLIPGQTIRVIDAISEPNVDGFFTIITQKMIYPSEFDEVTVGDKIWRTAKWRTDTVNRIQKIEEELFGNQDLLLHIVQDELDIPFELDSIEIQSQAINNSFILNHPVNGRLGVVGGIQPLLGDFRSAPVVEYTESF